MIAILKDIIPIIENSAPMIASALGSPMSGVIIKMLCDAFGASPHDLPALISKIQSSDDAPAIFKSLESANSNWISGLLNFQRPNKITISIALDWN